MTMCKVYSTLWNYNKVLQNYSEGAHKKNNSLLMYKGKYYDIKMNLREIEVSSLGWICVTQDPVGDSCGHCKELSVTIKDCKLGMLKTIGFSAVPLHRSNCKYTWCLDVKMQMLACLYVPGTIYNGSVSFIFS
jgi:hypothetical protein